MTSFVNLSPTPPSAQTTSTLSTLQEPRDETENVQATTETEEAPVTGETRDDETSPVLASSAETTVPVSTEGERGSLVDIEV